MSRLTPSSVPPPRLQRPLPAGGGVLRYDAALPEGSAMTDPMPSSLDALLAPKPRSGLGGLFRQVAELEALERQVRGALPPPLRLALNLGGREGATLTLLAASPAVATQLRFHQGAVLAALRGRGITHLRVRVGRPSAPSARSKPAPSLPPAPRPPALAASLLLDLAEAEGGPLGEALARLARRAQDAPKA
jgi:hypothetical protein